jgi:glycosyltransferase involved in cell wall biosynthesis
MLLKTVNFVNVTNQKVGIEMKVSKNPKISVLMSVYNGDRYLSEAIESVLKQSFMDFEFLIIDDGSTDNSKKIIEGYSDNRIKYFYKQNTGVSKSLNYGLKIAKGKYIARLDADDICYEHRLKEQYNFMETYSEYVLCGSTCDVVDINNDFIYKYIDIPFANEEIIRIMKKKNCFVHSSTFYRKNIALKIGGYYEPIRQYFEDYMFFYEIIKHGKSYNFRDSLIRYRVVPGSISSVFYSYSTKKVILNIVKNGFATEEQINFLNKTKRLNNEKRKLSNYHCKIFRLLLGHQLNFKKSFFHLFKAISIDPSNFNSYASFIYSLQLVFNFFRKRAILFETNKEIY